eukprot:scaffold320398_cov212-Cyclotella_meneghiniana.AAC.1
MGYGSPDTHPTSTTIILQGLFRAEGDSRYPYTSSGCTPLHCGCILDVHQHQNGPSPREHS